MKNIKSVAEHIQSIKQFTFQQRFFKWESYIKTLQIQESQYYQGALQKFVQYYPFNYTYWILLCQQLLKIPKGKANVLKMYQVALTKNSRCISLWRHYLQWLKKQIWKTDPNYLKNQYEKATKIIGTHYGAAFIFQEYFQMQKNIIKKYEAMKKALVSPLGQIDKIFDIIVTFIDTSQNLTPQLLDIIAKQQNLEISSQKAKSANEYYAQIKQKIKTHLRKLYEPTKKHVQMRYEYESINKVSSYLLKLNLDQYQPYQGSIELWRNYLHFIKNSGNIQLVYPLYERALISLCDSQALWEDYFLILQGEGNYNRALYLLRSHSTFFQNLSRQITYYWLEIEERESPQKARELYIQLQKNQYNLEAFIRHIQLELRSKQYSHAKTIYETILTIFTSNLNIIAYVVVQYAEFSLKYFRDIQFSKKLLKNYFQSYPYNEYLFINYLEFYIKNIEYKEGSKDSKEVFDQFMSLVCIGLKRTLENTPERYELVSKVAKKCIRNYISSIYLVKAAERKIKQIEILTKKQKKTQNNVKRNLDNDN